MSEEKKNEVLDQEKELNMDELVAGGSRCACVIGGGGTADEDAKTCACVVGGGGEWKSGGPCCVCPLMGGGD